MITPVYLPQFELTMESAIMGRWLVKLGDNVAADQCLVEVETQKATSEVLSPVKGVVRKICVADGETVSGKTLLCILSTEPDEPIDVDRPGETRTEAPAAVSSPAESHPKTAYPLVGMDRNVTRASPATRKLARELNVDITLVRGSGPLGRVTVEDIQTFASAGSVGQTEDGWTHLSPARLALNAQMKKSLAEIPQIVVSRQLDVSLLMKKQEGITFTHRLVLKIAAALERHPGLRTVTDGSRTKLLPRSVAVAIDTPAGLVAPVLRGEHLGSLEAVARRLTDLRTRAEKRELKNEELKDGPFALTNLGMLGVDLFTPFIFHGQTAVLAVGRAADAPTDRKTAWFSLAVDHRIVDGAAAARFLMTLQEEMLA